MSEHSPASQRVAQLAASFCERIEKDVPVGERPVGALIALRTQHGLIWDVAGAGRALTKDEVLRSVRDLEAAVREGEMGEGRRIG